MLEKGADILSGASKGNSALLHTGFDAPGSLELSCMQHGYREYLAILERLNLPLVRSIVLPVPTERTKGVLLSRTAHVA